MKVSKKFISFICGISLTAGFLAGVSIKNEALQTSLVCQPILKRTGYTTWYDARNRIPYLVYEKLTPQSLTPSVSRKDAFSIDPDIFELHRSTLEDYARSGFDRGHLGAAANHRSSEKALNETFLLSNICPQNPQCNRGVWSKIESYVRSLVSSAQSVDVYTGPLFLPEEGPDGKRRVSYQVIGPHDVAVPTHLFKLVHVHLKDGKEFKEAFLVPNRSLRPSQEIKSFSVSVTEIEKLSGIVFPWNLASQLLK